LPKKQAKESTYFASLIQTLLSVAEFHTHQLSLADFTAGREFHPALKTTFSIHCTHKRFKLQVQKGDAQVVQPRRNLGNFEHLIANVNEFI
jgi:hypothetical protein